MSIQSEHLKNIYIFVYLGSIVVNDTSVYRIDVIISIVIVPMFAVISWLSP